MARKGAEVHELAGLVRTEHGDAAGALAIHAVGPGVEVREHDVVLDAVSVDEADLDDIAFHYLERGVHDPLDVTAGTHERQLAFRQLSPESEAHRGCVLGGGALLRDARRRGSGALRLGHVVRVAVRDAGVQGRRHARDQQQGEGE